MTIERKLQNCMTVADLKLQLESLDPDAKVLFVCDYGDYCHTQQALPVEQIYEGDEPQEQLVKSAYSKSGLALVDDEDDEGEVPSEYEQQNFVVLQMGWR